MVVLEIDLDEGLPVVVALVQFDVIELVAGEIELARHLHAAQIGIGGARPLEQQTLPVFQLFLVQVEAGIGREMRRADQFSGGIVGPAMDRADDVLRRAGSLQHDGLAVAADIGHAVDAVGLTHQEVRVVRPFGGTIVVEFGHHQLMADIPRPGIEDELLLQFKNLFVEIPIDGKLGNTRRKLRPGRDVGHDLPTSK